jgi:phosphoribosyl 1,2-cyclic phosphate phosphodiesterase
VKITFLGTGATHPVPKPCCECEVCAEARKEMAPPEMRTGPGIFISDINSVIDTSQDISFQLNRESIKEVDRIFYTHWHPDHTMGMMVINQITGSYDSEDDTVDVFFPEGVMEDLRENNLSGMISYYMDRGLARVEEDFELGEFGKISLEAVPLQEPNTYGYSISEDKKIFYAPCDVTDFDLTTVEDHDIFILEFGGLDMEKFKNSDEITDFYRILDQLKQFSPEKVIFTHIEENRGMDHKELLNLSEKLEDECAFEVDIAYDGKELSF